MPRLGLALAAAGAGWVVALGPAAVPSVAPVAAAPVTLHRAAVIVDTGTEVKRVCVRFPEESITGIEALARAAVDPVLRAFPGKGAAVCALCGTGCPGDGSCLTCDAGGRFWSYSRAPAGTAALRTSGAGASSTTVRDGDVEAWQWGRGGTPPFTTVEEVCGEVVPAAPATTVATAGPPATSPPPGPASTIAPGAGGTPTTAPRAGTAVTARGTGGGGVATTTAVPSAPSSPPPPAAEGTEASTTTSSAPPGPTGALAASSADREDGGGGGWAGLAGFAAVLTGLVAWAVVAGRRRRSGD